jgi:hypothetical protein
MLRGLPLAGALEEALAEPGKVCRIGMSVSDPLSPETGQLTLLRRLHLVNNNLLELNVGVNRLWETGRGGHRV